MQTVLNEWTKEEVRFVIPFFWAKEIQPAETHCELATVYGTGSATCQSDVGDSEMVG
jgi:hypothetical protein